MTRRAAAAVGWLLAAVVVLTAAGAPRAAAHAVDPSVLTVIDLVEPAVDGITVEVGTSVTTQLLLRNDTADDVDVLDEHGQAFLRIGPNGVQANLAAPAWYLTNQPFGDGTVPPEASPDAPDRWGQVSAEHAWGWFDHRLHPTQVTSVLNGRPPTFEVPLRHGGRTIRVLGHLERRTTVPRFTAELRSAPDRSTGLVVQLVPGRAPGLFVRYDGDGQAEVRGRDGEPFLRLSPRGAEVNERSPTWLFTAQARGEDLTGLDADPAAAPAWVPVGSSPSYAWLDPRALIERVGDRPITLDWTVPITVDGRAVEVGGRSLAEVAPIADLVGAGGGGGPGRWLLPVCVLTLLMVAGVVVLVRGRG